MMEGCLPFINENNGDRLPISLNSFVDVMEGCLPFLIEKDGDMLTISAHFFYKYDGGMQRMETCLLFLFIFL